MLTLALAAAQLLSTQEVRTRIIATDDDLRIVYAKDLLPLPKTADAAGGNAVRDRYAGVNCAIRRGRLVGCKRFADPQDDAALGQWLLTVAGRHYRRDVARRLAAQGLTAVFIHVWFAQGGRPTRCRPPWCVSTFLPPPPPPARRD